MPCQTPPNKCDQHDSFEVPNGKGRADDNQKNRRKNEAPLEALEQRTIAVGANHSRQMVAHCAECSDEKINVLRTPTRLCQQEDRQNHQRRADVQDQVAPTV
jgi:hypothetical protein